MKQGGEGQGVSSIGVGRDIYADRRGGFFAQIGPLFLPNLARFQTDRHRFLHELRKQIQALYCTEKLANSIESIKSIDFITLVPILHLLDRYADPYNQ